MANNNTSWFYREKIIKSILIKFVSKFRRTEKKVRLKKLSQIVYCVALYTNINICLCIYAVCA